METMVPMISALCHPKVSSFDAGLNESLRAIIDIPNPIISEDKWAVSVKMAILLAKYPPTSWTAMKKMETKDTSFSFFMAML